MPTDESIERAVREFDLSAPGRPEREAFRLREIALKLANRIGQAKRRIDRNQKALGDFNGARIGSVKDSRLQYGGFVHASDRGARSAFTTFCDATC